MPKLATQEYNLQIMNPALAREWHPNRNEGLTPRDVRPASNKKVWWKCKEDHNWKAQISSRSSGVGCPYCAGKKVCDDNCLLTVNQTVASEWHPTRNGSLTPSDVIPGSSQKAWWICHKGHEWKAIIANRSAGRGCPYCAGKKVCDDSCLLTVNQTVASEWHPTRNGSLTPSDVIPGSSQKAWWICDKGHEWKAIIASRNRGAGCPYCSGHKVCDDNCLLIVNPKIAKQWHPVNNGNLTSRDVTPHSHKKVWWICSRGHEWRARVFERNRGTRCPHCYSQTSRNEIRIYTEMKYLFSKVEHQKKLYGVECDVYIPELNLGIEVDGSYWHKDKYTQDLKKTELLSKKGVNLLRVREKGLKSISADDVFVSKKEKGFSLLLKILNKILKRKDMVRNQIWKVKEYLKEGEFRNNEEYLKLLHMLPFPIAGNSLEKCNKKLADQWHPTRNGSLTPSDVTPGSSQKAWWICNKGHEWEAIIVSRHKGAGCPYCAGQKAAIDNSLQTLNPSLSGEWNINKNGSLTPSDVTPGSSQKVWWTCDKGHEWKAMIVGRNKGTGCPYCSGRKAADDTCLQTVNPELALEWHPTKNINLTPKDIKPGSAKKVWWICKEGHDWKAQISSRNIGRGCPYCAGKKVCDDNCLLTVNPKLAKQWHPSENGELTPNDVTSNSGKKVWWICKKMHVWHTSVACRTRGRGCPYCSGQKVCDDNCLLTVNPKLAKQWHPTKNHRLNPKDVTIGSGKKVWWVCDKGHEWKAQIVSRKSGTGCPYCSGNKTIKDTSILAINPINA